MDEALKRRLIGAGLLLVAAFLLVSMLPEPRLRTAPEEDLRVVTIDLNAPEIPAGEAVALAATDASSTSAPAAVAAPTESAAQASEEGAPPEIGEKEESEPAVPAPAKPAPTVRPSPPSPAVAAKPATTPDSKPAQVAAAKPSTASGPRWWVQIGSYSDIANARQVEARLRELQQPAVVAPIDTAKGTLYRVRGGPYASETQAQAAHAAIVRGGYADARMVKP